jgi:uncharacterized protein YbbC (DUF1343 family)
MAYFLLIQVLLWAGNPKKSHIKQLIMTTVHSDCGRIHRPANLTNFLVPLLVSLQAACSGLTLEPGALHPDQHACTTEIVEPQPAAHNLQALLPLLDGKRVAAVVNHTSTVGTRHLVDTLLERGVRISRIFAPEHGFRGTADAGEPILDATDPSSAIPVLSLYGSRKKPRPEDLADIDIVIFDIQDVGVRFYTYLSTLTYVLEACADAGIPVLVLDRPNPNGHYVDGPVLDTAFASFVGLHPVPVVYGMTIGEYARMVVGEQWLHTDRPCLLTVLPCLDYDHTVHYKLPIKPSPNLPNMRAVYLYPSLCFFEGTPVSVGRGTDRQFQVLGAPEWTTGDFRFVPVPTPGAMSPPQQGKECRGVDLSDIPLETLRQSRAINLSYLVDAIAQYPHRSDFFLKGLFFDKLAGQDTLRRQLTEGRSAAEIRSSWLHGIRRFKDIRKKYLLYMDFE